MFMMNLIKRSNLSRSSVSLLLCALLLLLWSVPIQVSSVVGWQRTRLLAARSVSNYSDSQDKPHFGWNARKSLKNDKTDKEKPHKTLKVHNRTLTLINQPKMNKYLKPLDSFASGFVKRKNGKIQYSDLFLRSIEFVETIILVPTFFYVAGVHRIVPYVSNKTGLTKWIEKFQKTIDQHNGSKKVIRVSSATTTTSNLVNTLIPLIPVCILLVSLMAVLVKAWQYRSKQLARNRLDTESDDNRQTPQNTKTILEQAVEFLFGKKENKKYQIKNRKKRKENPSRKTPKGRRKAPKWSKRKNKNRANTDSGIVLSDLPKTTQFNVNTSEEDNQDNSASSSTSRSMPNHSTSTSSKLKIDINHNNGSLIDDQNQSKTKSELAIFPNKQSDDISKSSHPLNGRPNNKMSKIAAVNPETSKTNPNRINTSKNNNSNLSETFTNNKSPATVIKNYPGSDQATIRQ